jgi:hypothetical protein
VGCCREDKKAVLQNDRNVLIERTSVYFLRGCPPLSTGVLISPYPDLLPDVFCLMVRIFRLMLVLFYIYIYIYSTNIPPIMIINRLYGNQNFCRCSLFPSWSD